MKVALIPHVSQLGIPKLTLDFLLKLLFFILAITSFIHGQHFTMVLDWYLFTTESLIFRCISDLNVINELWKHRSGQPFTLDWLLWFRLQAVSVCDDVCHLLSPHFAFMITNSILGATVGKLSKIFE